MDLNEKFEPRYSAIAYEVLSQGLLRGESFLCTHFRCSRNTLARWRMENKGFADAIEHGLLAGEEKFRQVLALLALKPGSRVNTKLLTTLASSVYGINEAQEVNLAATQEKRWEIEVHHVSNTGTQLPEKEEHVRLDQDEAD